MLPTSKLLPCALFSFSYVHGASRADLDRPIDSLVLQGVSAREAIKALAFKARIPMGITGFVSERHNRLNRTISLKVAGQPTRDILQEICRQDPQYKWAQQRDGGVKVQLGERALSLTNLVISIAFRGNAIFADSALTLFLEEPKILRWEKVSGCHIGHRIFFTGGSLPKVALPNLEIQRQPMWSVLNELSVRTARYFWSAIGSAPGVPCFVDVDLLRAQ